MLFLILALASCRPEPPTPEPVPLPTREAVEEHRLYFPVVARAWPEFTAVKRGVGMPSEYADSYNSMTAVSVAGESAWYYDWSAYINLRSMPSQTGAFFVPMLWSSSKWQWDGLLPFCDAGYNGPILWLNEPDLDSQANTSPDTAVSILERLRRECPAAELVGPNLSQVDAQQGWPWLRAFLAAWSAKYDDWPPTTLAFHAYNIHPASILDSLSHIGYNGRVWVTEWGWCTKSAGESLSNQSKVLAWLEQEPRVVHHAIFAARADMWRGAACNSLMDADGRLTAVGEIYRGGAGGSAQAAYP